MSLAAKLVLLFTIVPILGVFFWGMYRESSVTIPPGKLGLLVIKGKPTDKTLLPGLHWVPALRKRTAVDYPSVELAYRALDGAPSPSPTEAYGPPLHVTLGDRADAVVGYTVRFRLDPPRLRLVHERFGQEGIWAVVRDDSMRAVSAGLSDPAVTLDSLFGSARAALEETLGKAVAAALDSDSLVMTSFALGSVDLGRTGEVIQSVVRARLELEREEAEAATRAARVRHDAELAPQLASVGEAALRYRQTDVWRDLFQRSESMTVAMPGPGGTVVVPAEAELPAAASAAEESGA
jgi:regulator of protease activity HflC (stomatin/prohibitin superfamily)